MKGNVVAATCGLPVTEGYAKEKSANVSDSLLTDTVAGSNLSGTVLLTSLVDIKVLVAEVSCVWACVWRSLVGLEMIEGSWRGSVTLRAAAGWGCMLLSGVSPVIRCVVVSWSLLGIVVREKVGERRAEVWWRTGGV